MNDDTHPRTETSEPPDADHAAEGSVVDPLEGWDAERARCPVARHSAGGWTVAGHAEMLEVLRDHDTFSNEVSAHLSVPNGMDPPVHGPYRTIVEGYFGTEAMEAFEPTCRDIVVALFDPWIAPRRAASSAFRSRSSRDDLGHGRGMLPGATLTDSRQQPAPATEIPSGGRDMQQLDVRTIPPRERHPQIFELFDSLDTGDAFELVNDHDPKPLFYQFQAERPGKVEWEYLESGPDVWRVRIGRA